MNNESLINYERTWKTMICLNPKHNLVKFDTNKIGDILCPTCGAKMVTEVKFIDVIDMDDELNDSFN